MNEPCRSTPRAVDVSGFTVTRVGNPSAVHLASLHYVRWLRTTWFYIAALLAVLIAVPVQAADMAKGFGGANVQAVAADNLGQTYIAGYFADETITLGTQTLTRLGVEDAFVAKLDPAGDVLWARNFGGVRAQALAIAVDTLGQVYVAGLAMGDMSEPPLSSIGPQDAFVLMLAADGQSVGWSQRFGGSTAQTAALALAVDGNSNVHIAGWQSGDLTTPPLPKIGYFDAFAIKLSAIGGLTWAKNFGGANASAYGQAIAVSTTGNVFLAGGFELGNLTTPALTMIGNFDAFAIKLNSSGSTSWAQNFGGLGATTYAQGIAVDSIGDVYVAGDFCCADLTSPTLTRLSTGTASDAYTIKIRGSGEHAGRITWAANFGGAAASTYSVGLAVGPDGNVYVGGGYCCGNVTVPPLTPIGTWDAFYLKLDKGSGGVLLTRSFGGVDAVTTPAAIAVDGYGNVILGGTFAGGAMTSPPIPLEAAETGFVLREFSAGLPFATTGPTTGITRTGATLNGTAWSNGTATSVAFEYGLTTAYGTPVAAVPPTLLAGAAAIPVTAALTGLTCETTYHYRVNVANLTGSTNSADLSFTTASCVIDPPKASTHEASAVSATAATLNGDVTANGDVTSVSFQYGLTTAYGFTFQATPSQVPADAIDAPVYAELTGLACNTLYHFRAVAVNAGGTAYGDDLRFVTEPCGPASVTVKPLGTGIGWVTSSPEGINCGPACSEPFAYGTSVTLNATTPFYESVFSGWGGACEGIQATTCTVIVTDVAKVTATFQYTGTLTAYGDVQDAYIGYYGRPAEPQGRAYWAGVTDEKGQGLTPIIDAFGNSPEFLNRYGMMTNPELIYSLYQQLFARDPDPTGFVYWLDELDSGRKTLQRITLDMIYGAKGNDAVTFENKRSVANYYSQKVVMGCPYGPELDGVDILSIVNLSADSVTEANELIDVWCDQPVL